MQCGGCSNFVVQFQSEDHRFGPRALWYGSISFSFSLFWIKNNFSDYLRDRTREEYIRGDYNINSEPQFDEVGPLYTVSQRFEREKPHLGSSSVGYGTIGHDVDRERERDWDRSLHSHTSGSSDTTQQSKESSSVELQSDDQQPPQLMAAKREYILNSWAFLCLSVIFSISFTTSYLILYINSLNVFN